MAPRRGQTLIPSRGTVALGLCVLLALASTRWVRLNVSPSLPLGLYRLTAVPAPLPRDTLVVVPVPVSVQPWHWWFSPLLKPVAAIPGDVVCHQGGTLYVGGADYGPVYQVAHGTPLPQIAPGCAVVPEAHVFLATNAPNSLDSRYFGLVPVETLTAQAFPLWTWR